ncbi:hypothetical protein AAFF_G00174270 [Aldrovandia affinis]|uniref:Uncharacterized protein n=1 Tax=Aldrovandia affinis TaxID=143900 RepID=A0AAD7RLN7_9TELE|nr:hypothetical protein AAFF_G00174270 [Aldrovandia affinis]
MSHKLMMESCRKKRQNRRRAENLQPLLYAPQAPPQQQGPPQQQDPVQEPPPPAQPQGAHIKHAERLEAEKEGKTKVKLETAQLMFYQGGQGQSGRGGQGRGPNRGRT